MISYVIILILLIYSIIVTYLYIREKRGSREIEESIEGDLDLKIHDIRKRLNKIKRRSRDIDKIDLEDGEEF